LLSFAVLYFGRNVVVLLALGIIMLDAGMQGLQITNQSIVYSLAPNARSRINSAYMVCAFIGAALGSLAAGQCYAHAGWRGDCLLARVGPRDPGARCRMARADYDDLAASASVSDRATHGHWDLHGAVRGESFEPFTNRALHRSSIVITADDRARVRAEERHHLVDSPRPRPIDFNI